MANNNKINNNNNINTMESKTIVGKCPLCGGDVIKTMKGFACVNSLDTEPACQFFLFSTIGNRRLSDLEVTRFLEDKSILLDGFATKEGKNFTSILSFNLDGSVSMSAQIGNCPKCGGTLYVNQRSVSCTNFNNPSMPCKFTIWRNIGGHEMTLDELRQIITNGTTTEPVNLHDIKGNTSRHRIGLNADKEVARL